MISLSQSQRSNEGLKMIHENEVRISLSLGVHNYVCRLAANHKSGKRSRDQLLRANGHAPNERITTTLTHSAISRQSITSRSR